MNGFFCLLSKEGEGDSIQETKVIDCTIQISRLNLRHVCTGSISNVVNSETYNASVNSCKLYALWAYSLIGYSVLCEEQRLLMA